MKMLIHGHEALKNTKNREAKKTDFMDLCINLSDTIMKKQRCRPISYQRGEKNNNTSTF